MRKDKRQNLEERLRIKKKMRKKERNTEKKYVETYSKIKKQYENWNFLKNRNVKNEREPVTDINKKLRKQTEMKKPKSSHTKKEYI